MFPFFSSLLERVSQDFVILPIMRLPIIEGVIRRRILVNYRVDPQAIVRILPSQFRPKLHGGYAVAGICLIRLEHMRPVRFPEILGISSENAAHRIAVNWDTPDGATREGVFIPRRDTDSELNHLAGGTLFAGRYHKARFTVAESASAIDLSFESSDKSVSVRVSAHPADSLPHSSIFSSLAESSSFFEGGSLGYSATNNPATLHGMVLETREWRVEPLGVDSVYSSFFADPSIFPESAAEFDHALLMKNITHQWRSAPDLHL